MMPEEPNSSEELLKRYAKERRAQGGDFSLHPATRRLLQGEVARTFGKHEQKQQTGWSVWFGSWTGRLALGTGAAAVVLTGFLLVWNARQDRYAMELAQATFPEREAKYAAAPGQSQRTLGERQVAMVDAFREEAPRPTASAAPVGEVTLKKEAWFDDGASRLAINGPAPAQDAPVNAQRSYYFASGFTTTTNLTDTYALSLAPVPNDGSVTTRVLFGAGRSDANLWRSVRDLSSSATTQLASAAVRFDKAMAYGLASTNAVGADAGVALSYALETKSSSSASFQATLSESQPLLEFSQLARAQKTELMVTRAPAEEAESRARFVRPGAVPTTAPVLPASPVPLPSTVTAAKANAPLDRQSFGRGEPLAANVPAPASALGLAVTGERYYRTSGGAGVQKEAQKETLAESTVSAQIETFSVLSSFLIEQAGNTVRLVDADGSIYDGTIEVPLVTTDFDTDSLRLAEKDAVAKQEPSSLKPETALRHQELSFRVTGSNVTLRQNVVVSARILSRTNAALAGARGASAPTSEAAGIAPEDSAKLKADVVARRLRMTTERGFGGRYGFTTNNAAAIEGTVRIGATNQQWFRATPQPR